MIRFSLKRILENAPYDLTLSDNNFVFQTDLGIHYMVSFIKEDIVLGGCATYQLIIRKIEEEKSPMTRKWKLRYLLLSVNSSVRILKSCFTFATQAMGVKNIGIACSLHGLTGMLRKIILPSAKLMQLWKVKACSSASLLTIGIRS